jgi:hypothetical protein
VITIAGLFCGAGGSGLGASVVPDGRCRAAEHSAALEAAPDEAAAAAGSLDGATGTVLPPSAGAVEFDTVIAPGGQLTGLSAVQRIRMGAQRRGQRAHVWADEHNMHVLINGRAGQDRPVQPVRRRPGPAADAWSTSGRNTPSLTLADRSREPAGRPRGPADHLLAPVGPLHRADCFGGGSAPVPGTASGVEPCRGLPKGRLRSRTGVGTV